MDQATDWTALNIREIRHEIADKQADLRRVIRDGEPTEAQQQAVEEAVRLLGQVREVLAPAAVEQ